MDFGFYLLLCVGFFFVAAVVVKLAGVAERDAAITDIARGQI